MVLASALFAGWRRFGRKTAAPKYFRNIREAENGPMLWGASRWRANYGLGGRPITRLRRVAIPTGLRSWSMTTARDMSNRTSSRTA